MRIMILTALTGIAMIAATGADAAQASGSIKTMDMKVRAQVTLADGKRPATWANRRPMRRSR